MAGRAVVAQAIVVDEPHVVLRDPLRQSGERLGSAVGGQVDLFAGEEGLGSPSALTAQTNSFVSGSP